MVHYDLIAAHKHASAHQAEILASAICGCFYCKETYPPSAIGEWIDDENCALCPRCGIDSVIGDASGLPVAERSFLDAMYDYWFDAAATDVATAGEAKIETVTLYRPVGAEELALIAAAEYRAFPPRLPEQPIFYPVTNEGYATQIARDWNTRHGSRQGFVTRFLVEADYAARFERQVVGGREHEELWVPAEELAEFNSHIIGAIEVIASFEGDHV